jgi:hypothetical protein
MKILLVILFLPILLPTTFAQSSPGRYNQYDQWFFFKPNTTIPSDLLNDIKRESSYPLQTAENAKKIMAQKLLHGEIVGSVCSKDGCYVLGQNSFLNITKVSLENKIKKNK